MMGLGVSDKFWWESDEKPKAAAKKNDDHSGHNHGSGGHDDHAGHNHGPGGHKHWIIIYRFEFFIAVEIL